MTISLNNIGGKDASIVWLNFWAAYGGSIISVLISLYILKKLKIQCRSE